MPTSLSPLEERLLRHALGYAKRGVAVFPCSPETKQPLIPNGFKSASKDPNQIKRWWSRQHRGAMIGAATGPASGFFAVDLDVSNEKDGLAAWAKLIGNVNEPLTLWQGTPSGGQHHYFRWPEAARLRGHRLGNRANCPARGIDIRGEGGYVILPPSERADGVAYAWPDYPTLADVGPRTKTAAARAEQRPMMTDAPDWLLQRIMKQVDAAPASAPLSQRAAAAPKGRKPEAKGFGSAGYVRAALDGEAETLGRTMPGGRGAQLNTSAYSLGQLMGAGLLTLSQIEDRLFRAATLCGLVAEDGAETVRANIHRAAQDGAANPRRSRSAA